MYDLSVPCQHQFTVWMENPKAAQIQFGVCSKVECHGYDKAMGCVLVPGNDLHLRVDCRLVEDTLDLDFRIFHIFNKMST